MGPVAIGVEVQRNTDEDTQSSELPVPFYRRWYGAAADSTYDLPLPKRTL